jgi:cytochrome c oxidase subunit 4
MSEAATVSVKTYFIVFVLLLVALFTTVGLAFIPTHHEGWRDLLTLVGFSIAGFKAILIILWFMHVKISTPLTWVFASAAFVWLVIMFVLTLSDYTTRAVLPAYSVQHVEYRAPGQGTQEHRENDSKMPQDRP